MKIKVFINAFPKIEIDNIDVSTFNFHGPTEGYSPSEERSHSTISFVAENAEQVVEEIRHTFRLNPEYSKPEDYIRVRTEFPDYQTDKRPRVIIRLNSGMAGLANPPEFTIFELSLIHI